MANNHSPRRIILVGESGEGKTQLLIDIVQNLRKQSVKVEGVLSPGIFDDGKKVAIELLDLATNHSRICARLALETKSDLEFGDWAFDREALAWGNQRLNNIGQTDVFVLDEVGPLELEKGEGLQTGLEIAQNGWFKVGLMTARPNCVRPILEVFPESEIFNCSSWDHSELLQELIRIATR